MGTWSHGHKFPEGLRIIVIDCDPVSLSILNRRLRKCNYQVTEAKEVSKALQILSKNKTRFDLVISDARMLHMEDHWLFEQDIPIINTQLVMKGILQGACEVLQKPISQEIINNIWQHALKKNPEMYKIEPSDLTSKEEKKRKNENTETDNARRKNRVVWTPYLHSKFIEAINVLGQDNVVPKKILNLMNVKNLTRENVASHLQKYRMYMKRMKDKANQQSNMTTAYDNNDLVHHMTQCLGGYGECQPLTTSGLYYYNTHFLTFQGMPPLMNQYGDQITDLNPLPHQMSHIFYDDLPSNIPGGSSSRPYPMGDINSLMLLASHQQTNTIVSSLPNQLPLSLNEDKIKSSHVGLSSQLTTATKPLGRIDVQSKTGLLDDLVYNTNIGERSNSNLSNYGASTNDLNYDALNQFVDTFLA